VYSVHNKLKCSRIADKTNGLAKATSAVISVCVTSAELKSICMNRKYVSQESRHGILC